ncbi:tetratricopeptide repeat protein [Flavobacteriaceae bacterium Ap0902]|nr:tetratricopeptide repeat protein [Flavobacteriaceae bacterium Ap0902]
MKQLYILIIFLCLSNVNFSWAQTLEEKEAIQKGNAYYLQKEYDKARASYERAIAQTPSSLKGNYNLGNTYYELKKYDQAITHYTKAAKAALDKETKAHAYHNLGNAYMQKKQYKEAIETYKKSLRNNPSDNQTRYNFALAKKLLNNQQRNQNPPDLPKPSDFAKQMKAKADAQAREGKFLKAYDTMKSALEKDSTVLHFQSYMDKLNEVIILDTIQLK